MSDFSSGSAAPSSNRPPLNQSTVSKPTRPPRAITRNRSPARSAKCAGVRRACSSIRVNMWTGQQAHVVGEHAEDEPVDEVRDRLRVVAAFPQPLRDRREGRCRALGERLPRLARPQPLGVRERPLEPVACRGVGQVVQAELVGLADAVRPVGADAEPQHVGDDQQRRVLQRQRVQPQLSEGRVEVGPLALVLPGEVMPLPHVRPAVAAGILARAPLEAVRLAGRVGLGRRRLAEQPAQVDEVLLRRRPLLECRGAPLGDEVIRRHGRIQRSR